jgi:hypothetical protein
VLQCDISDLDTGIVGKECSNARLSIRTTRQRHVVVPGVLPALEEKRR